MIYYQSERVTLYHGDCVGELRTIADQSVHCCITSPPYWGLRDYGVAGQLGLEKTPEEYTDKLVEIFAEVRRVLRDDGTLWLNLGDSYAANGTKGKQHGFSITGGKHAVRECGRAPTVNGLKPKDLVGIPWRVAFALQSDGWYLRQDIIWHKPNPMPESVRDRCTKSHEYLFLLSKSPKYFFDAEAIKERSAGRARFGNWIQRQPCPDRNDNSRQDMARQQVRNRRSVWSITPKPYKGAHFATFPPALVEPCILAGCPEGGTVLDPFLGSGTTAAVALAHNRQAMGIELNADYLPLISARLAEHSEAVAA